MGSMFMRYPGGKKKALTLSYDDGVEQDIRLIELMKKNGLKGTFNLNSGLYAEEGISARNGTQENDGEDGDGGLRKQRYGSSCSRADASVSGAAAGKSLHGGGDKRQGEFGEAVSNDRKGYGISLRNYQ